jgi:hypothetical protein
MSLHCEKRLSMLQPVMLRLSAGTKAELCLGQQGSCEGAAVAMWWDMAKTSLAVVPEALAVFIVDQAE